MRKTRSTLGPGAMLTVVTGVSKKHVFSIFRTKKSRKHNSLQLFTTVY
jgi:hypothetical protein